MIEGRRTCPPLAISTLLQYGSLDEPSDEQKSRQPFADDETLPDTPTILVLVDSTTEMSERKSPLTHVLLVPRRSFVQYRYHARGPLPIICASRFPSFPSIFGL